MFIANEFFDALPVNKFVRVGDVWHEILVDVASDEGGIGRNVNALKLVKSRSRTPNTTLIDPDEKRTELEISPETGVLIKELCDRVAFDGGAALIVDYGHDGNKGDTLRAFKEHRVQENLLELPGSADLTADVDFSYIRKQCPKEDVLCYGPVNQVRCVLHWQNGYKNLFLTSRETFLRAWPLRQDFKHC